MLLEGISIVTESFINTGVGYLSTNTSNLMMSDFYKMYDCQLDPLKVTYKNF